MGGVVQQVGDVVNTVVFKPIQQVGNIVSDVVREVGHAVESVGREVGKIGQAAINDPAGTMLKVAAIASGQWWALPLVSAGLVVANGGDIGQAALAAGVSLAAQGVAYGVGEAFSAGSSAALDMAAADTANLAAEGFTAGQISEIIAQSYPEIGSSAISQMVEMGAMGIPAAEIAADVGSQMAIQNLGAATAANTLGAGTRTALTGGDLSEILTSAGTAGLGTAVGGGTSMGAKELGASSKVASAIGKGAGAAAATAASGKDGANAFFNSLINTTLSEAGGQAKSYLKTKWNELNTYVSDYNAQLDKTNQTQEGISSLFDTAKAAEENANSALESYKPLREKFSDLVTQYDEAKAAGNTELANSLADQANALIPELTASTEAYNNAYTDYESKLNQYTTGLNDYQKEITKTDELKAGYETASQEVTNETKALADAAQNIPKEYQKVFEKMYTNGETVDDSLKNIEEINSLSGAAKRSYFDNFTTTGDYTEAKNFAVGVNSLDEADQNAFVMGLDKGLDGYTALEIAPTISMFDAPQQDAYTDAIKQGYAQETADFLTTASLFNSEPQVQAAPQQKDIAGQFSDLSLENQSKFKALVNDPNNPVSAEDALASILDAAIPSAQASELTGSSPAVDPNNIKDAVYRQDENGKWGVYVPDNNGGFLNTGAVVSIGGQAPTEGELTGDKFVVQNTDEQGVPNISMMPYFGDQQPALEEQQPAFGGSTSSNQNNLTDTNQGQTSGSFDFSSLIPSSNAFNWGAISDAIVRGGASGSGGASTSGNASGSGNIANLGSAIVGAGGTGTNIGNTATNSTGTTSSDLNDPFGGIKNLQAGLTNRMDYTLSGLPTTGLNGNSNIPSFAGGGGLMNLSSDFGGTYNPDGSSQSLTSGSLKPSLTTAQINYILSGMPGSNVSIPGKAEGGMIEGHNPTFYSEGGLSSMENRYVEGEGDGTSDSVAAMLANGEFVIPADVVSKIGNGSNEAGAGVLDQFLVEIRQHANSNGTELPPESKGPLGYLLDAKRKVKA